MSEEMHKKIKKEADELGVSFNSHLIELAWMGMKVREASHQFFPIPIESEHR